MSRRVTATALRFCRTGYDAVVELCVLGLQTSNSIATRCDWLGSNGFDGGVPIQSGLGSHGCNADGVFCLDSELAQRHAATITTTTTNPHTAILPKAASSPGLFENGKTAVIHCGHSSPMQAFGYILHICNRSNGLTELSGKIVSVIHKFRKDFPFLGCN